MLFDFHLSSGIDVLAFADILRISLHDAQIFAPDSVSNTEWCVLVRNIMQNLVGYFFSFFPHQTLLSVSPMPDLITDFLI